MKKIELICTNCSGVFIRPLKEYTRSVKKGQINHFCNQSCSNSYSNKHREWVGSIEHLDKYDEFTPFRYFIRNCIRRGRGYNLDLEFLKELWDNQKGICPITGWKLELPRGTVGFVIPRHPVNASLDRIDSSKGYIKGNVRFVALIVNIAKSDWNDDIIYKFCKDVVDYNK